MCVSHSPLFEKTQPRGVIDEAPMAISSCVSNSELVANSKQQEVLPVLFMFSLK